jgi:hypothetical protein
MALQASSVATVFLQLFLPHWADHLQVEAYRGTDCSRAAAILSCVMPTIGTMQC